MVYSYYWKRLTRLYSTFLNQPEVVIPVAPHLTMYLPNPLRQPQRPATTTAACDNHSGLRQLQRPANNHNFPGPRQPQRPPTPAATLVAIEPQSNSNHNTKWHCDRNWNAIIGPVLAISFPLLLQSRSRLESNCGRLYLLQAVAAGGVASN